MFGWLRKQAIQAISGPSDDDYQTAALEAIYGRVEHLSDLAAWLERNENRAANVARAKKGNAKIRQWASTLEDKRFARAVNDWMDYYDKGIREYEEEMRTNKHQIEMDDYEAENKAQLDRIKSLFPVIPTP